MADGGIDVEALESEAGNFGDQEFESETESTDDVWLSLTCVFSLRQSGDTGGTLDSGTPRRQPIFHFQAPLSFQLSHA